MESGEKMAGPEKVLPNGLILLSLEREWKEPLDFFASISVHVIFTGVRQSPEARSFLSIRSPPPLPLPPFECGSGAPPNYVRSKLSTCAPVRSNSIDFSRAVVPSLALALASTPLSTSKPYFISTMIDDDDDDDDDRASSARLSTADDGGGCGGRGDDDGDDDDDDDDWHHPEALVVWIRAEARSG